MRSATWSAPVRYAEVDGQNVVFNAHYLTYCDESLGAFLAQRGLPELAEQVRLVTSTLTWRSSARWGEVVSVDVRCVRVGRTSFTAGFVLRVGERVCCEAETVYVLVGGDGTPTPLPDRARDVLVDEPAQTRRVLPGGTASAT